MRHQSNVYLGNALQLSGAQHYYNRHRDYDPTTGRYLQADPIGLAGDENPYAYARGNALRYVDPSGEFVPLAAAAAVAGSALIGAGGDLAFQAAMNWANGNDVLDPNCYDWGSAALSSGLGAIGAGPSVLLTKATIATRVTRSGGVGIRKPFPNGRVVDITAKRVKEFVPNTHPNARPGSLRPVKFPDSIPGSKGLKRTPTPQELKQLEKSR
ncbi:MAG: hypothetical protein RLZZ157_150 [Pseudomonadota bacterium]|jgi:RHS repeat-associated protein